MDCLLYGGAQTVGKSETIHRLALTLISKGFNDRLKLVPPTFADFTAVLDGTDKNGKLISIILNSATDTATIIKNFKAFFDLHGPYDILISSVRDGGFWPRQDFFDIMGISYSTHYIIEIPLAKLTRRGPHFATQLSWYQKKIDTLTWRLLNDTPFDL